MKHIATALIAACAISSPVFADDIATAKEAETLVGKLVKPIAANKDAIIKEINAKDTKWVRPSLYPFIMDSTGVMLAHGGNEKLVGKNQMTLVDVDGKYFVREIFESTLAKGKAWIDYKFGDPVTKKVLPKSTYCEKVDNMLVCAGIYKP